MASPETPDSDRDGLAAEYVLGTLDGQEIVSARRLLTVDRTFAAEVSRWRVRLDPLIDAVPELEPPAGIRDAVLAAVERSEMRLKLEAEDVKPQPEGASVDGANIIDLSKRIRFWRSTAIATSALAASLLAFVAIRALTPSEKNQFVAVLENSDRSPAFVASVDVGRRTIAIKKLAPPAGEGRSYELWAIEGKAAPVSLGVVDESVGFAKGRAIDANVDETRPALTLAVTVEPQGGSPTGKPSGKPVYVGTLVQAPDR